MGINDWGPEQNPKPEQKSAELNQVTTQTPNRETLNRGKAKLQAKKQVAATNKKKLENKSERSKEKLQDKIPILT